MGNALRRLGRIDAPLLIFGGPYGNLAATETLIELADDRGFGRQNVICTGDVVAYCAEPEETCRCIMQSDILVVRGNCEESLANNSDSCGCGFEPGMVCSTLSEKWYRYANAHIGSESRAWMASLPRAVTFDMCGYSCRVIHGGVEQTNRFVFASTDMGEKRREMEKAGDCDVIVGGHSGLPFGQAVGNGAWLNAGVIGLPANDGTPDGWFMRLDPHEHGIDVTWRRLRYDYRKSRQTMLDAGLDDYADCIASGRWPSLDVLPDEEKSRQGIALSPKSMRLNGKSSKTP